ncbi:pyrimidine 5'-nucleotidase [Fibrobacter sp. UWB5]|uniref:pyrimidine 5'-nucleotidase n=1 Tax=Fibrobacter sp. UWB5 TaxID=1964360 RepID=UPI000B524BAF|nr:pyrimidine 5'-nucleotidase [Fibrobacter sp. UWB5]OWV13426.1 pyrimidine 5'-nucleotidase [Fibrobacter sp. UWB5]
MVWLFDYDLTLYGAEERCVLNSLDHRISLFVQKTVGGDFESAHKIRTDYLERFGTTLAGLMAMHQVNPDDFFDFIHEPEYLIYPKKAPEKLALLQSLKGPRFVFTNGRHDWSEAGMAHMGIDSAIDGVFDLKLLGWEGKPHESAYDKMEKWLAQKLPAMGFEMPENKREIVLLDDGLRNLEPAHRRGWTTIFVNPASESAPYVDYHIPHLMNLRDIVPTLIKM